MKKIYLILTITICVSIILFVATFFYIDIHRHTNYFYNIYRDRRPIATVKLDKYNTEDKLVYKSVTNTPFHSTYNTHKRKLSIDKRGLKIYSYNKKHLSEGISMDIYIKGVDSNIDFLAVGHSNFAYAKSLPVDKGFVIFEEDAIISYFNLIDKYDFKRRGLQSIPALTHTYTFLPPYKNTIQLKLGNEETIKLGGKKIKALHLIAKLPDKKEISIWVNRWTHTPLLIRAPKAGFEATWSETPEEIAAKKYAVESELYENREVSFKNKDIILAGTLSMPKGQGPFPAIILVWGSGPMDRDALGMFVDIADGLAKSGIAVLRFDKRGVGKSEANFSRFTGEDLTEDLSCAVDFLIGQDEIDKERIATLGHSEGGYYAASSAAINPDISACIIMGGVGVVNLPDTELEMLWSFDKSAVNWDKEYLEDIAKTAKDTSKVIKNGKDWTILLHKRVYLRKCRLDLEKKPLDIIRKIRVPVLILSGRRDTIILPEYTKLLEEVLKEGGNENYQIIDFNRLNHFFGKKIEDGIRRTHLAIDGEVIGSMKKWLNENLISPPKEELVLEKVGEEVL